MRILMLGTGTFAEPTFQALLDSRHEVAGLVTNPDRPSGRERDMLRHIKQVALDGNVPVFQPENINTPEGLAGVREFKPDLLVVAAYGQILSKDLLEIPPHGCINVHASLLPKYRGAAPIAWAIYHGETRTGVTIIKMSPRMDAGDMLTQEAIDILSDETAGELEARLAPIGAMLALSVIDQIETGATRGIKQDLSQVTKAPKLKKEHGLIDWSRSAEQVVNQIRAMQPWPTAYTYWHPFERPPVRSIISKAAVFCLRGKRFFDGCSLVSTEDLQQRANEVSPGMLVAATNKTGCQEMDHRVVVATGSGLVDIRELQPAGKRRMTAAEFLRGHRVEVGDRFGPETE